MTVSLTEWTKYRDLLAKLSQKAADEFRDAVWNKSGRWGGVGLGNIPREELIEYVYALATKYGEGTAALACEYYDAMAELSGVSLPSAVPAETATIGEVGKALNGAMKFSTDADYISNVVGRLTKQAGQDTTLQNSMRDGAQFAWIPAGETCAFCLTLASRGWQYVSKKSLKNGHAEHIHSNCDCAYAVRFNDKTEVEGYDPERYRKMYYGAEGNTPQERINSMRREAYAEARANGASPNNSELFNVNWSNASAKISIPQNIREELDDLERKYYTAKAERYFAIDEEGELIFDSGRGGSRSVSVPRSVDERMEGGYSYHNHTADATFSPTDISNYEKYGEHGFITTISGEEHILYNTNPVSRYKEVEEAMDDENKYAELMPFSTAARKFYSEAEEIYTEARREFSRELVRVEPNSSIRAAELNEWMENNPNPDRQMVDWLKENAQKYGFIFEINTISK